MASVKKPKVKGKNRLRLNDGGETAVAIVKTWEKGWRKCYPIGPRTRKDTQASE